MVKHKLINNPAITVYFYHDEGKRPHLHVKHKNGTDCSIWLDDLTFKKKSRDGVFNALAKKLVKQHQEEGLQLWNEIFNGGEDASSEEEE